ncbi:hypothetical protein BKA64DRAFT_179197 [Cadophora sp. MPI-SDFR-AT-0126]|nr:hypothetical protein BKA64DRAFT_179197 [Leotiomycetes sp. MPI-SDFR-AT-0126]
MGSLPAQVTTDYHRYVPVKGHPKFKGLDKADPYIYSKNIVENLQFKSILTPWQENLDVPFAGITSDGFRRTGLYRLQDEGAPTAAMVAKACSVLDSFTTDERVKANLDIDSEQWRKWSNPEIIIYQVGVRIDHLQRLQIDLIMDLLKHSLSEIGYAKIVAAIKVNRFLGEICRSQAILNEHSYFFAVYGTPSEREPWGFSFYGHHLCLNIFAVGSQMTISPVFIGAEPNVIDSGPDQGLVMFTRESDVALDLMNSLSPELRIRAQIFKHMHDAAMPEGRWNPADQRHLAGAFQDNRLIPYEGILATEMQSQQQAQLLDIIAAFSELLPPGPFECRMGQAREHLTETYFSWIGGYGSEDVYYYRIQSPVLLLEFDHHSGVWLTNEEPAKHHIHTIIRTPNGNDYAREVINLHRAKGRDRNVD